MKKVLIIGLAIALSSVSMASGEDEMTSLSYISYLERYATVMPVNQEESLGSTPLVKPGWRSFLPTPIWCGSTSTPH